MQESQSELRTFRSERLHEREEILTSREARSLLKVGRTKLWDLTRRNVIPAYRIGDGKNAGLRYKRSELLAWLDRNRI
jgi:excisionase family DNA binding protein